MAFNTLEYLEKGNVDFVYNLTRYDYDNLIKLVRASENRVNIINGFLSKLQNKMPAFCFEIIYDIDEFKKEALYLLKKYYLVSSNQKKGKELKRSIIFSETLFKSFIANSSLAFDYLRDNFEIIIKEYSHDLEFIFNYLFLNYDKSKSLLKKLAIHSDLHVRYLFMKYLMCNHYNLIGDFYDDITKYLTSETYEEFEQLSFIQEYMSLADVGDLAMIAFDQVKDYELWLKFKKFILDNYHYNDLAYQLLKYKEQMINDYSFKWVENQTGIKEFSKDPDQLFETAIRGRLLILRKYSTLVSREILESYKKQILYFQNNGKLDELYEHIEFYGLDRTLDEFIQKYLDLSQDKTYEFIGRGSSASCYRIGDFAFKLVEFKWSYEQVICPELYLILPNLEEKLIRNSKGHVVSGIEVQRYLKKDAKSVPIHVFGRFREELERLGYYSTDSFINGKCGDNCRLLNDYLESGNPNPPEWFKEYPIVLVDHDCIYEIGNKFPKQLGSMY